MILPEVLIAGAQKSGTTTLHHALRRHPSVFLPDQPQEIHFFDDDVNYAKGLEWYARFFKHASSSQVVAQTSPRYIYDPAAPARIHKDMPSARLIFILRNPVDRAYSHYALSLRYGIESLPFDAALQRERERLPVNETYRRFFSYIDRGLYASQLERFRKVFPRDQMKVLTTERLKADPSGVIRECYEFVGVDPDAAGAAQPEQRNPSQLPRIQAIQRLTFPFRKKYRRIVRVIDRLNLRYASLPSLEPALRSSLWEEAFADDAIKLERDHGVDTTPWRTKNVLGTHA